MYLSKLYLSFFHKKQFIFALFLLPIANVLQAQSYSKNCFEPQEYYNPSIQEELEIVIYPQITQKSGNTERDIVREAQIYDRENRHVLGIEASSFNQVRDAISDTDCKCIKKLTITGHGEREKEQTNLRQTTRQWVTSGGEEYLGVSFDIAKLTNHDDDIQYQIRNVKYNNLDLLFVGFAILMV